jgi:hypothetical protein
MCPSCGWGLRRDGAGSSCCQRAAPASGLNGPSFRYTKPLTCEACHAYGPKQPDERSRPLHPRYTVPVEAVPTASLHRFNALPAEQARAALLACCASAAWAQRLLAGHPCSTVGQLLDASEHHCASLSSSDVDEALSGHPRIGDRADGSSREATSFRQEQAARLGRRAEVLTTDDAVKSPVNAYVRREGRRLAGPDPSATRGPGTSSRTSPQIPGPAGVDVASSTDGGTDPTVGEGGSLRRAAAGWETCGRRRPRAPRGHASHRRVRSDDLGRAGPPGRRFVRTYALTDLEREPADQHARRPAARAGGRPARPRPARSARRSATQLIVRATRADAHDEERCR